MDRREKLIKAIVPVLLIAAFLGPVLLAQFLGKRSDELAARREAAPTAPADAVVDPERQLDLLAGEQSFMRNCGMCHGYEAVGKVGVAPSLSNPDFLALATDKFIRTTVREGRLGTAMAPRREIPRQELNNIITYLRSSAEAIYVDRLTVPLIRKDMSDPLRGHVSATKGSYDRDLFREASWCHHRFHL
jgi:mono/diheme cytochrome c family protein